MSVNSPVNWRDAEAVEFLGRAIDAETLLVALDFDGTLAPLVDEPMTARAAPHVKEVVADLTHVPRTIVAYVSGRSLRDLREISEHDDDSEILLAGSHGAEHWVPGVGLLPTTDDAESLALRDELIDEATQALDGHEGVWIEPKAFGFAVHSRLASAPDAERANRLVDEVVRARAAHWRRRVGRNVQEYAFRHEGKDSAVAALRERTGASAVLFAGDDVTDEDAMRSLGPGDLGVRVGPGESAASVRAADPDDLADLLAAITRGRSHGL